MSEGIRAHDVTVTYRNGHTALRDATFEIPTGTITALVGVNGAGKSTLFKAIMGFVPAAKGRNFGAGDAGEGSAEAQYRGLCSAVRGGRLVLSGAGGGCRDDGPLRPHGLSAPPQAGGSCGGHGSPRAGEHGQVPAPPDRRAERRAAQARVPRTRLGAGGAGDLAGRAVYRRRCPDRGRHRRRCCARCATRGG